MSDFDKDLETLLDAHAEYYIKQTMRFFQEKGESPALSRNNDGDLKAKQAIKQAVDKYVIEPNGRVACDEMTSPEDAYKAQQKKIDQQLQRLWGNQEAGDDK